VRHGGPQSLPATREGVLHMLTILLIIVIILLLSGGGYGLSRRGR
jgi:hypothetical protein